jgi:ADP-heptose:LPS heptosyltransferase
MTLNTYIIEGGIGKCVSFTALLPKLTEKSKEPVQIATPHIDVFAGNPLVKMCYDEGSIPLDDPRILESDNIVYCEPYKSNFLKGDDHVLKSYSDLLGISYDVDIRPKLYTDHLKSEADQWLKERSIKEYILVQFTGGQTPIGWNIANTYTSSNPGRNYPQYFAQGIVNAIKQGYPDVTIIDVTLPNEPGYANTVKCDLLWPYLHELLKNSQGFIAIDSMLQHLAASAGVSGIVLWGNTRWTQFGWMHHKNMSFHDKNRFNTYYKMDINDPRNIMIEPQDVIDVFKRHVLGKNTDIKTIQPAHKK